MVRRRPYEGKDGRKEAKGEKDGAVRCKGESATRAEEHLNMEDDLMLNYYRWIRKHWDRRRKDR